MEQQKICTTSGRPVDVVRSEQTEKTGQHKDYIVLCPDERAKGFVRPYRDAYRHAGRSICGGIVNNSPRLGGDRDICSLPFGHEGGCNGPFFNVTQPEHAKILITHRKGGCGKITTMGRRLSETYARDPKFYGATFCVHCNQHLPVAEFTWYEMDGTEGPVVGS